MIANKLSILILAILTYQIASLRVKIASNTFENSNMLSQSSTPCAQNFLKIQQQNIDIESIQNQSGLWTDDTFPQSIALQGLSAKFKRATDLMKDPKIIGSQGIKPSDVKQGNIGNCYFVAALAALAQLPKTIESAIPAKNNEASIYPTRWYIGGKAVTVVVDNFFPVGSDGSLTFASMKGDKQFWPIILEKAWAKIVGSYSKIEGGMSDGVLHALTGAPVVGKRHWDISQDELFKLLEDVDNKKFVASTYTQFQDCGLPNIHSYTPLSTLRGIKATDGTSYNLVKVRNPWGHNQWKGDFSNSSSLWSKDQRVQYVDNLQSGSFFMKIEDYKKCFHETDIAQIRDGYELYSTQIQDFDRAEQRFTKTNNDPFTVSLEFYTNARMPAQDCIYTNKKARYTLYKIDGETKTKIESSTSYVKNIVVQNGAAGEYEVEATIMWNDNIKEKKNFAIGVYSSEPVEFRNVLKKTCKPQERVDMKLANGNPWHIRIAKSMTCQWFASKSWGCRSWGRSYANEGATANQACITCGGGVCP